MLKTNSSHKVTLKLEWRKNVQSQKENQYVANNVVIVAGRIWETLRSVSVILTVSDYSLDL